MKEGEAESLYDMISYNGVTDEHSISVCASYSYSAGTTDSSTTFSENVQQPTPNSRRSKLSYMGYVPMSPNTAAAMAMKEMRDHSHTHRHSNRNGDHDANMNDSGHTAGEGTTTTGSTFPSIKVDDTSTSRRRHRNYDDESHPEQEHRQSASSGTEDGLSQGAAENVTEYLTVGQQRILDEQKAMKNHRVNNRDSATVDHNSHIEDGTIGTSVESSVMPNSCTGHPAMKKANQGRLSKLQTNHEFQPLSPVVASPQSQAQVQPQTPAQDVAGAQRGGHDLWPENVSLLSPLTAGVSAHGMVPPALNHPSDMMQQQWNPSNRGIYQQQYGYQQQLPVQYPYGVGGNNQQYPVNQQQQQQQQPLQSGFFPRNPVLARQLQAFQQYHSQQQQQQQQQEQRLPVAPPTMVRKIPEEPKASRPIEAPVVKQKVETKVPKASGIVSSQQSNGKNSSSEDQPVLICGPEGPRLMENVKFVTPIPHRSSGSNNSLSSHSRAYGAAYSGGALGVGCAEHPAGMKCQSYFASFINTCGAIVNHGYHIDNSKSSSKEKRAKFGKVADKSIAGLVASDKSGEDEGGNGIGGIGNIGSGLNDAFAANAKKIFHAGNNMINTLPKDFHNLTQSAAAYHNVFDTFQKYTSPKSEDIGSVVSENTEKAEEVKKKTKAPLSPISAQREHFRALRRRRNRGSDTDGNTAQKDSDESVTSFSKRYSRNVHTKAHQEKIKAREPEDPPVKEADESKDDDSNCTWATPRSQEEPEVGKNESPTKPDPLPGSGSPSESVEDLLGERVSQDVVMSTSSGMSESLVGSDVGEEDEAQLDSMMNSSLSDEEQQEQSEAEEHLLLDSFDHNEFPHTELDVIEEGSEDEDTIVNPASINNVPSKDLSIDASTDEYADEFLTEHRGFGKSGGFRTPIKSMIGIVRFMFVAMLAFQCGTIICLWDQIAEQIRTMEGGQEVLANAETFVSNIKASGESLVTTAKDIIHVHPIDISVGEILSEIESRTNAMMGTASHFLSTMKLEREQGQPREDDEMMLFHQLVDDALGDDDVLQKEVDEDIVTATVVESLEQ